MDSSPRIMARIAGVCYLFTFLTGGVALYASGKVLVAGDPAATAANVVADDSLFRLSIAAYVAVVGFYVAVTAFLYRLFRPVSSSLSLLAAFFSLVGCAVQAFACVFLLAPMALLGGAPYLSVFSTAQLQALAYTSIRLYGQGYNVGLAFFGAYCLLLGHLILRSTFLPRPLGVLMALAGLGWLTFLWPPLASSLDPFVRAVGVLGEGSLTLWLLVRGVNAERWRERAGLE